MLFHQMEQSRLSKKFNVPSITLIYSTLTDRKVSSFAHSATTILHLRRWRSRLHVTSVLIRLASSRVKTIRLATAPLVDSTGKLFSISVRDLRPGSSTVLNAHSTCLYSKVLPKFPSKRMAVQSVRTERSKSSTAMRRHALRTELPSSKVAFGARRSCLLQQKLSKISLTN